MATATKEYERLKTRREELLGEREKLMREGEKLQAAGQMVGTLPAQIAAIESELSGVNPIYKAARRENGRLAATKLRTDKDFQAQVEAALNVIGPLAALERRAALLRAEGVAVPTLAVPLALWLKGWIGWFRELARAGAVDVAALPPSLRPLVEEEAK